MGAFLYGPSIEDLTKKASGFGEVKHQLKNRKGKSLC